MNDAPPVLRCPACAEALTFTNLAGADVAAALVPGKFTICVRCAAPAFCERAGELVPLRARHLARLPALVRAVISLTVNATRGALGLPVSRPAAWELN